MCGILFSTIPHDLTALIRARGPSHYGSHHFGDAHVMEAAVLALREPVREQPVVAGGRALAFNGEIYGVDGSDTDVFWAVVQRSVYEACRIEGEFAFIFYDTESVWFSRDCLGRRSLMYSLHGGLTVTSVGGDIECEAGVLYHYTFATQQLEKTLFKPDFAVSRGLGYTPNFELQEILRQSVLDRTVRPASVERIAVLFSGGLDCTIVARLLDLVLPPQVGLDLLNVAFENRRTGTLWDTPDRLLAKRSLLELQSLTSRSLDLVEINVPYATAIASHDEVRKLMWPHDTVMDLSIAMAFFFASQGERSKTPILFSGLGADELFAGYSRHLGAFAAGPEQLACELELDFGRIGTRNLGRDDRVSACWGKEVRYPFLSSAVVDYALALPLDGKTDGVTTKIALRNVARSLGLGAVCDEKKRAIQFGARSAKMDPGSSKLKGHNALSPKVD